MGEFPFCHLAGLRETSRSRLFGAQGKRDKKKQCAGAWRFLGTMGKEEKRNTKKLVLYCLTLRVSLGH
jgi:hypothetical protein